MILILFFIREGQEMGQGRLLVESYSIGILCDPAPAVDL